MINQAMPKQTLKKSTLFFYLLILTLFFFVFEFAIFIRGSELYLGDFHYISKHIKIPATIIPGIFYFSCVQLSLHLIFIGCVWILTVFIGIALKSTKSQLEKIML